MSSGLPVGRIRGVRGFGVAVTLGIVAFVAPCLAGAQAPRQLEGGVESTVSASARLPAAWTFRAASPFSGVPLLSAAGQLVLSTQEGYAYGLDEDGGLAWSYTTVGGLIGSPVGDARGRIYLTTQARRLYAIEPTGALAWTMTAPVRILSGAGFNDRGYAFFVGADQHLWAVSPWGRVLWRSALPDRYRGVFLDFSGSALLGTRDAGLWQFTGRSSKRLLEDVSSPVWVTVSESQICAGDGQRAQCRTESEVPERVTLPWRGIVIGDPRSQAVGPSRFIGIDGRLLGVFDSSAEAVSFTLSAPASAAPAWLEEGSLAVPLETGVLARVDLDTGRVCEARVLGGALFTPIVRPERILLASRDGAVGAVDRRVLREVCR